MDKLREAARQVVANGVQGTYAKYYSVPPADFEALREALAEQVEQEPIHVENVYKRGEKYFAWIGEDYVQIYTHPVRTKDLTEPLIDELRECRDLLMCVESCSRNNFENLAYERVQAIDAVIAVDREKNK